jgi:predicted permease
MFCAINSMMLRNLPLPEPDRLVSTTVPPGFFREFTEQQTSFEGMVSFGDFHANFRAAGAPSRREACFITANFLDVLRAKPLFGRGFLPGEDATNAAPVAILSYKLWQEEFQGDRAVLDKTIWLDGQPKTVVGVMPANFRFPINDDFWIPSGASQDLANRETGFVFARLKPGLSLADARIELNTIWPRLYAPLLKADEPRPQPIRVGAYPDALTGALQGVNDIALAGLAMALVSFFILFLACANVAMLTLGRAIKRGREFAIRSALGATRRRMILQLLVENMVLSTGGAIGGVLAAAWFLHWLVSSMPSDTTNYRNYPSWYRFEIDGHVLLMVLGLTFVVNLLAGLWPALQATKRDVNELLKGQTIGSSHLGVAGFQRLLVISQVAASVVILVAAFALIQHRMDLSNVHLPFDPNSMFTVNVNLSGTTEPTRFYEELDRNLSQLPGVEATALASEGFAFWHGVMPIEMEGKAYPREQDYPRVAHRVVTPDYFAAVNLPLLQGRGFRADDGTNSTLVAVVNATFAERYFGSENPLGRRIREEWDGRWLTVVGCVPDALVYGTVRREPVYYVPFGQHPRPDMKVLLRVKGKSALAWTKTVGAEVARLQPDLPISGAATVKQELNGVNGGLMGGALALSFCGVVSLLLAAVGIFGLITLSVNQRTREIGIRLAMGSTRRGVVGTILVQGMRQIGIGLVAGLVLAIALVKVLSSVLPDTASQPWAYFGVVLLLGGVSIVAVLIPAVRGSKVDPMVALRYE